MRRGLKRVVKCSGCGNVVRLNRSYRVYYCGEKNTTIFSPPEKVEDLPMQLCQKCYEASGYKVRT